MSTFTGLELVMCKYLAGTKKAFRQGRKLIVSPAMYDLISHADERELRLLLETIRVVVIPELPNMFDMPMTIRPPIW